MSRSPLSVALIAISTCLLIAFSTGCGSDEAPNANSPQAKAAIAKYRSTLENSSEDLAEATRRLLLKVEGEEHPKAESRYAAARVPYGQVVPAATLLDDLDSKIDTLSGEVPADEFGGFHRIEKALWVEPSLAGMTPVARKLYADVKELQRRVKVATLRPTEIADAASTLLDEVAAAATNGGEEPYSHIDLVDIAARLEGAEAGFDATKPLLAEADPELAGEIEAGFEDSYRALRPYGPAAREPNRQPRPREPGIAFVIYDELEEPSLGKLARPMAALAELFSQVPDQIS